MSMRASPTLIGAFVLGASVLLVAGLLLWGGTGMFKTKYRYVMYFETAVTGLQKGAPVVLRGFDTGVPELPTVPTTIEVWTAKLEKIADALAALPLDQLARSAIATIDE